ncbi:MAG TPA: nuclear transport factor 2 family protein [Acidimicrobiales bacterium]|nr:nuclear transport factor 2 family protein [Acidimicrobiales bacterium]
MTYEEERILGSIAARSAVADLSVRQHRAFERSDFPTWVGTFVVRGVLELAGQDPIVGHGALETWFSSAAAHGQRILMADPVVEIDGVQGTQESTLLVLGPPVEGKVSTIAEVISASDELIFERGRWYFARRRFAALGA